MTKLEPFSWTRSKFVKIREFLEIAIFDILAEISILRYGPNFGAIDPVEIRISLRFDKKYFARYHFRFEIFSLF